MNHLSLKDLHCQNSRALNLLPLAVYPWQLLKVQSLVVRHYSKTKAACYCFHSNSFWLKHVCFTHYCEVCYISSTYFQVAVEYRLHQIHRIHNLGPFTV